MDNDEAIADHLCVTHLTTILGNAQMLQRRIARATSHTASEQIILVQELLAIEQALRALQTPLAAHRLATLET